VYINNDPMRPLVAIGDQAYAREEHLCPKHREASLNAMGPTQADHARAVDKANMQYRVEVEQSFNHVCTLWPFIDCVRKHKIFQGGVNNFTNLADTWYAMALITNLLTCLRGSHSTARFQIEPAGAECGLPALQAYLHSANNGLNFKWARWTLLGQATTCGPAAPGPIWPSTGLDDSSRMPLRAGPGACKSGHPDWLAPRQAAARLPADERAGGNSPLSHLLTGSRPAAHHACA
jgi:hypothetical protein